MNRKKKLARIFMVPVLVIVLIQGILPFLVLRLSGTTKNLEKNIIQMDVHTVENRQVVLENDMIEQWRSVYLESDGLTHQLTTLLDRKEKGIDTFLCTPDLQKEYLRKVFPDMVDVLQHNTTSGLFLILANDNPVQEEAGYRGFFVRDSDPDTRISSNTDLLLEKGDKKLAQDLSVSLDSAWSTDFHFAGHGNRSADDFFYKPYVAATEYPETDMVNIGYWAKPFILEDHYMDNHQMITYSVPLICDNTVYGVLGVEISVKYLSGYFSLKELDNTLNAGYALVIGHQDGEYECIFGKGSLYDAASGDNGMLKFKKQTENELYKVIDAQIGKQDIYAITKPLNLYSNNVPYEDTDWMLCGFVTEDSIYGPARGIYQKLIVAILFSALLAGVIVYITIRYITNPVYRLVESVRGGVLGIHNFRHSDILEVDELHEVVEKLTDAQRQTQEQLLEEKERYRLAVESSQDMFFTFRKKEQLLEIVNSNNGHDGIWDCKEHPEWIGTNTIHPEDRAYVCRRLEQGGNNIEIEFRMSPDGQDDYIWVLLSGSFIQDDNGEDSRIVGCLHNINQRKLLEEERKKKQFFDPVTSFYRMTYGIEQIRSRREKYAQGVMALTDISKFTKIDEQYGIIFGDMILQRLAYLLQLRCDKFGFKDAVAIRAGADQILLWIPDTTCAQVEKMMDSVQRDFAALTDPDRLALKLCCGITQMDPYLPVSDCIEEVKQALTIAKRRQKLSVVYQKLSGYEREISSEVVFEEVASLGRIRQMSLSSLTLNLFDKAGDITVILDVLALKIQAQYPLANVVISSFNHEYLVNTLFYRWQNTRHFRNWDGIIHCQENTVQSFLDSWQMQEILPVTEKVAEDPIVSMFVDGKDGLIFHMQDNAQYTGSILFMGIPAEILEEESERKLFYEISSIIQNRINLQRHDLSAQAKSDFLARMSHEIRTPMNGIMGMTEIALTKGQTDEKRIDCLEKIRSSSTYLLGLLNDILDMSKIESGKMKLVEDSCNLPHMLNGLKVLLESKIAEKDMTFVQDIDLKHSWFKCDELRLNQILVNLLGNAVKYSGQNGQIRLCVKETQKDNGSSALRFAVSDNGIGIPKEKQQLIFQSFEQADDSDSARRQGTGLGLAISSHLVHMMNSEICLESIPGEGSTFSFTVEFPWLGEKEQSVEQDTETVSFEGKRVLVVEDNLLNMEITHTILEGYGILVDEAYNGQEAVDRIRDTEPGIYDLILMDIMMPVMDGLEAARMIRRMAREDCKTIPIVAMSANAFEEDVRRSLESGMNGHLSKPVDIGRLKEMLGRMLAAKPG